MHFNRRKLLLAGISSLVQPVAGCATGIQVVRDSVDVAIVGAGAAGLAAARTLQASGKTTVVLEARDRIGGRAFTTTQPFGVPFDLGAHWLHYGENNPFKTYAQSLGGDFAPYQQPQDMMIWDGRSLVCHGNCDGYNDAVSDAEEAIWDQRWNDQAVSDVVDSSGTWGRSMAFSIGPWDMSKLVDRVSTSDWSCTVDGDDYLCRPGYGALLARSAEGIAVHLSCKVSQILQRADRVELVTDCGKVEAGACIVTVSNGVLASGQIRFSPGLSAEKTAAIDAIPMGHYARVGLAFTDDIFGAGSDQFILSRIAEGAPAPAEAFGVTSNVAGRNIIYCDAGGPFARSLEQAGKADAIAAALDYLRDMLGRKTVDASYSRTAVATDWGGDAFALGSYASADPGSFKMREILRTPTEGRVFLAGEACSVDQWATVGGAHISGCETAMNVVRFLEGEPLEGYGSCDAVFDRRYPLGGAGGPFEASCSRVRS